MQVKKTLFIICLLFNCISFAFSDTIDFYKVYHNKELIKENSSAVNDTLPAIIIKAEINENDSITINYFQDHPCENCKFYVVIIDEMKKLVKVVSVTGIYSPLSFSLQELLSWSENNFNNVYEIYYYREKPAFPVHLFKLILK